MAFGINNEAASDSTTYTVLREFKPLPRHLTSAKDDLGFESRFPDSDPDVCQIAAKMWSRYLVGLSHYTECHENGPVTV